VHRSVRVARSRRLVGLVAAVVLAAALTSCGGDEPAAASSDSKEPVVIDVTIADGEVSPAGKQVDAAVGQPIEVHVDSDAPDELHVHSSPEHEYEIKPADDQVFRFSIDQPGQVEIETHETDTVVAELVVS
jgi:hypothetical protein